MVPSKVEVSLRKADQVSWGKLEDPNYKPEPEPVENTFIEANESLQTSWDIEDDDISDSDEEWAYDTPENKENKSEVKKTSNPQIDQRKELEEEIKKAMEEKRRAEEEKRKREEQRMQEEEEGYEDMPDLE